MDDQTRDYEHFFQLLRSGSREESEKWQLFLEDLSVAIGSLSALLDCDIILGGTIGAYMIEDDRRRLQQLVRSDYHYAPSSDLSVWAIRMWTSAPAAQRYHMSMNLSKVYKTSL